MLLITKFRLFFISHSFSCLTSTSTLFFFQLNFCFSSFLRQITPAPAKEKVESENFNSGKGKKCWKIGSNSRSLFRHSMECVLCVPRLRYRPVDTSTDISVKFNIVSESEKIKFSPNFHGLSFHYRTP